MDNLPEPTVARKTAARAMLADGNSMASVADVFGVPVRVLEEWTRESAGPSPAPVEAVDPAQALRERRVVALATPVGRMQALGPLALTLGMLGFFLWGTVPLMVDSAKGSPPIEQLHRSEGWVKTWRDCYSLGRNTQFEQVTLVGPRSTVTVTIPCVLPAGALSDGKVHRMTVLTALRRRLGTVVYGVELDGRTLVAYADVKQSQDDPWKGIGFVMPVLVALLIAFAAALRRYLDDRRRRQSSADD